MGHAGVWLVTFVSKDARMIYLQFVISRGNAAVFGHRSVLRLVAVTMAASNMMPSAAVVLWMRQSQLDTPQVSYAVARHCAAPICRQRQVKPWQRKRQNRLKISSSNRSAGVLIACHE